MRNVIRTGLRSWLNNMSWAVVRPGSLSTASLLAQCATLDFLTFSMTVLKKNPSSLEWYSVEVAMGLTKLCDRLPEAVAW